jgi:hypothetical protein
MREKTIEQYLIKQVKSVGGSCYKWSSPSQRGVLDQIIIWKYGIIDFVELKTEKGKLSELQEFVIKQLNKQGCSTFVLYGKDQVNEYIAKRTKEICNLSP